MHYSFPFIKAAGMWRGLHVAWATGGVRCMMQGALPLKRAHVERVARARDGSREECTLF